MKISIDKDKCIKCGLCVSLCPKVFVLKEEGVEVIHKDENLGDKKNNKELTNDLEMAKAGCPNMAITIEEINR